MKRMLCVALSIFFFISNIAIAQMKYGQLNVISKQAKYVVFLDDKRQGETPLRLNKIIAGTHLLVIINTYSLKNVVDKTILVKPGELTTIVVEDLTNTKPLVGMGVDNSSNIINISDTMYENKMKYKREKIELVITREIKGKTTTSTIHDILGIKGVDLSQSYFSGQEIKNWTIVMGGYENVAEEELCSLAGDQKKADEITKEKDAIKDIKNYGSLIFWCGAGVWLLGSSIREPVQRQSNDTIAGAIGIIGLLITSLNNPKEHYLDPLYAMELADKYNIKLKRSLYLPDDYEP